MIKQEQGAAYDKQMTIADRQEEQFNASCNNVLAVSRMKEDDIEKVLEIEKRSFTTPWTKRMFSETLSSPISICFIIEERNILLGYIMLYFVLNEAHILNLAMHPDHRGKGYASKLIRHMIDYCGIKGISEFFLEVRENNIKAKNLYMNFGFEVIGKRKRYYTDTNEDALVMKLFLH